MGACGKLWVRPGDRSGCVIVHIINDATIEELEHFNFQITAATVARLVPPDLVTVAILDDDNVTSTTGNSMQYIHIYLFYALYSLISLPFCSLICLCT